MLEFIRRNFRWIAGGFMLTYFSSFGQTYFISASVAEWQAAFGLTHGEFGRLYMFATLASAFCLPLFGRLVDVLPAHRMIALVVPVLAGAALLAGNAFSVEILVVAIFLLRLLGQGMMTHIALAATGRWFVAERGRAVSLVILGHQGGEATIPLAFAALTISYGYRVGWFAAAVVLLVIGLPCAYWCFRKPRVPHGQLSMETRTQLQVRDWSRREVLRDPVFWGLLTGVLAPAFIGTTIFYHQNYLTALHNWPPQYFAMSLLVMALTTVGCALMTGSVIRHRVDALRRAVAGNLRPRQSRRCAINCRLGRSAGNGCRAGPDRHVDRYWYRLAGANDISRHLLLFGSGCDDACISVVATAFLIHLSHLAIVTSGQCRADIRVTWLCTVMRCQVLSNETVQSHFGLLCRGTLAPACFEVGKWTTPSKIALTIKKDSMIVWGYDTGPDPELITVGASDTPDTSVDHDGDG
jgi:MFS family permease